MEADDERHTSSGTGLHKIATVYNGSIRHGTPRDVLRQLRLKMA
jgi:hypothetical protein